MAEAQPRAEPVRGGPSDENSRKFVPILNGYQQEAEMARRGGVNPRDQKWRENLDLYWGRNDYSKKADWQAKQSMPEVASFVDRFAAALKEALVASPNGFYTVHDPADREGDITQSVKNMTDVWLSICGRNMLGQCLGFPAVFEEQAKLGALMACSAVTTWKDDVDGGRVAVETVDPRNVWLDPTYRNLYRIRRIEMDKHELRSLVNAKDKRGSAIYNLEAVDGLISHIAMEAQQNREDITGGGAMQSSTRQPVTLDEYVATVVDNTGKILAEDALMVVANGQYLIRGPEKIPYWHGKDWMTYAPLVTVPLSVYGRSYMEDFGTLASTFNQLTNLLLDAVQTSAIRAYAVVPEMLLNPNQLNDGISPNKLFYLDEGRGRPEDFFKALEMGMLAPEAINFWSQIKNELREAADLNEVALGQFAPKGRTSAQEISSTQESSSALIRSVAQTIETRWLNPTLDLVWKTGLQHATADNKMLAAAAGEDMYKALIGRRKELIKRPVTFQAMGISMLIQKQRMLKSLLTLFQVMAQSDILLQEFLKVADLGKVMKLLFQLSDIDLSKLQASEREKLIAQFQAPMQQAQQQAAGAPPPGPGVGQMMGGLAKTMGVARQ